MSFLNHSDVGVPIDQTNITCPNCGYRNTVTLLPQTKRLNKMTSKCGECGAKIEIRLEKSSSRPLPVQDDNEEEGLAEADIKEKL